MAKGRGGRSSGGRKMVPRRRGSSAGGKGTLRPAKKPGPPKKR